MANIITRLSEKVSNQIAAGEVVQRPSSVVKELLENAVDAKATKITLTIKDAGKTLIQVVDNGVGMSEEDALMCFEKHATSKIKNFHDLEKLYTMGFRGEALASIASIAKVELETAEREAKFGTKIIMEGLSLKDKIQIPPREGTTISVKNIFFNVPARRKFLKSDKAENKYIVDEFIHVSLAHPESSFTLIQEGKEIFNLKSKKLNYRIIDIFGNNYQKQILPCNEESALLKVSGYIGKPEFSRKNRTNQFLFINKRYIKNNLISMIIKNAYGTTIKSEEFPFYVIFIEIDPQYIDINIHPTKSEVKFENENIIYSSITAVVRKVLSISHVLPTLDFEKDQNFNYKNLSFSSEYIRSKGSFLEKNLKSDQEYAQLKGYNKFEDNWDKQLRSFSIETTIPQEKNLYEEIVNYTRDSTNENYSIRSLVKKTVVIFEKFLLVDTATTLFVIDIKNAYMRINFDEALKKNHLEKQRLLFPITINFSSVEIGLLQENYDILSECGLDIDFGKNKIAILASAFSLNQEEFTSFLSSIIDILENEMIVQQHEIKKKIILSGYEKYSKNWSKDLTDEEAICLVERLFACEEKNYAPNGKKILISMDCDQFKNVFDKVVY